MTEAAEAVVLAFERLKYANNPIEHAHALIDLSNAMHDFKTWLPGYDHDTGRIAAEEEWI